MSCNKKQEHHYKRAVKYNSRQSILAEKFLFFILRNNCISDIYHHAKENKEHSKAYGIDENRIQLSYEGQGHHGILWMEPDGIYNILKSENASEKDSENGGEHPCAGYDSRKSYMLYFIKQEACNKEAQPLSKITVHRSEDK